MGSFEWRTDEDVAAEEREREAARPAPRGRRGLKLLILVIVIAAALAGRWVYQRGSEHVAEATAQVEADVNASHQLVRRAAMQADLQLFQRFLSSSDPEWAEMEEQQLIGQRWLDRSPLRLSWQQTISSTASLTVSLNLQAAEVVSHELYGYINGDGEQGTARLAQTFVYRLGPDRWLYAPPQAGFWGEENLADLRRIRLTYPERDEELARQLAADLNDMIDRACEALDGIGCPVYYRLSVTFSADPALLQEGQPGTTPLWTHKPLILPTPSLIGLPLDEEAYQALFLGYARHAVAAAISDIVGWRCCESGLFFQILLEEQLQVLGLAPPAAAPTPEVYRQMLQAQVDVGDAGRQPPMPGDALGLWAQGPVVGETPSLQSTRLIIDFLRQRFPQSAVSNWQRELAAAENYSQWLAAVTNNGAGPALAMGWYSYLYDHGMDSEPVKELALPDEDLVLICDVGQGGRALVRFNPQTGTFEHEVDGLPRDIDGAPSVLSMAPSDGVIFASSSAESLRIYLWRDGQETLLWDSGPVEPGQFEFLGASPDGRFVMVQEHTPWQQIPPYRTAQVATCLAGSCHWRPSNYRMTWSPDGRYVVNENTRQNLLFLAESRAAVQPFWYMDTGGSAVWLDGETFAYTRHTDDELTEVLLSSVNEPKVYTLVDQSDLQVHLPGDSTVMPEVGLVRHPADSNMIFIALQATPDRSEHAASTHVLLARRDTGQLFILFTAINAIPQSLAISPAGRWLSLVTDNGLLLYDLVADRGGAYLAGAPVVVARWSLSGEWLFAVSGGRHYLIAPGAETRELESGSLVCDSAVWLGSG